MEPPALEVGSGPQSPGTASTYFGHPIKIIRFGSHSVPNRPLTVESERIDHAQEFAGDQQRSSGNGKMADDKLKGVERAKLAEQAERYEDMAKVIYWYKLFRGSQVKLVCGAVPHE